MSLIYETMVSLAQVIRDVNFSVGCKGFAFYFLQIFPPAETCSQCSGYVSNDGKNMDNFAMLWNFGMWKKEKMRLENAAGIPEKSNGRLGTKFRVLIQRFISMSQKCLFVHFIHNGRQQTQLKINGMRRV